LRILFVQEYYYPYIGGVETLFKVLAENLVQEGHQVRVISTKFDKTLPHKTTINGVEVVRLPISSRYVFSFFAFFLAWKHSKGFNLIQTTSYNAALPAILLALFRRKKVVITFHEVWGKLWFTLPYLSFLERLAFYLYEWFILKLPFTVFVGVSDYTKQALLKHKRKKTVTRIYNGIAYTEEQEYSKYKDFTFTFFGRLGVSKGIDVLLEGAKLFFQRHPNAKLQLIIPRVPKKFFGIIQKRIEELAIADNIIMLHNLDANDLKLLIKQSHCVIVPSYTEGFCFTAVESIAMGVPIITSGKGALKEVVSGHHVIMKEFSAQGLDSAIERIYNEDIDYTKIKKFELNMQVRKYITLYKKLTK